MDGRIEDPDDLLIIVEHSYGQGEFPLSDWMAHGPGPRNTQVVRVRSKSTGEELPLTVIPLAYRNSRESRALIRAGRIASPWPGQGGDPPAFDGEVAGPAEIDRAVASLVSVLSRGPLDAEVVREALRVMPAPEFALLVPSMVRRLAAGERWADFEAITGLAGVAGVAEVGPVLCELLDSSLPVPDRGHVVEVLARVRFDDAVETLEREFLCYVYADEDLPGARRCLRAFAAIDKARSRVYLNLISWRDWLPPIIREWAVQELDAIGARVPSPRETVRPETRDSG
ncbi:hypothetical protein [Actinoplanes derwentensis]|uniref:Uncharacterized protein n=1 Tax=Actinoplanes derwentensis TaxID=113562 RepID=A0A1H2DFE8_9ACTN|nr:hypothetical protein [Actinoplanes derwentensis]GID85014.1 hypothetical protein Ade03nite_39380 [Actinoplanes derwentensis]SDT81222.1 hypothetical protein SAMN04489716_9545 [Actinoplanes derwentensis]